MSFYGDIKRVQSSPFVFDKYYPNRKAMEDGAASDGVYIGRYVLIKYTCKYKSDGKTLEYFNKYEAVPNSTTNEKQVCQKYQDNANRDIGIYKDTFDGTVWQKIYTNVKDSNNNDVSIEKYIMVAELNASVPRLKMEVIGAKYTNGTVTNGVLNETWNVPSIKEESSSEDSYLFEMPDMLHLSVGNLEQDFCAQKLINEPGYHYESIKLNEGTPEETTIEVKDMFGSNYNYVGWINKRAVRDDNGNIIRLDNLPDPPTAGSIDEKELDIKLYAVGRAVSFIYDVLYGKPSNGNGDRPFFTDEEHLNKIISNYEKGLVGILTSISTDAKGDPSKDTYERTIQPGLYYYFVNKWTGADEDPDNFIENIPKVVGSSSELSSDNAHFRINFAADSNYVVNTTTS